MFATTKSQTPLSNERKLLNFCHTQEYYSLQKPPSTDEYKKLTSITSTLHLFDLNECIAADSIGEGGSVSFTVCTKSFDGSGACGANDTVFADSFTGRKGGAIAIGSGRGEPSLPTNYTFFLKAGGNPRCIFVSGPNVCGCKNGEMEVSSSTHDSTIHVVSTYSFLNT